MIVNDPKNKQGIGEEFFILKLEVKIANLMAKKKMSKKALANKVGVSKTLITRILNGTSELDLRLLYKIAQVLNAPFALILTPNRN